MESRKESKKKKKSFGDYVLWFPKGNKSHLGNLLGNASDYIEYSMCCQITMCYW
jgi:hypothetical protein